MQIFTAQQLLGKTTRSTTLDNNSLSMPHPSLAVEADIVCLLLEKAHVTTQRRTRSDLPESGGDRFQNLPFLATHTETFLNKNVFNSIFKTLHFRGSMDARHKYRKSVSVIVMRFKTKIN